MKYRNDGPMWDSISCDLCGHTTAASLFQFYTYTQLHNLNIKSGFKMVDSVLKCVDTGL